MFHIQSAEDSHEFRYTLHSWHFFVVVVAFFQIPAGTENNGYSHSGSPAPSMSGVSW